MTEDTGPQRPTRDLDRDETHQDSGTTPDRSRTFRFFSWFSENLLKIVAVTGLALFVLGSFLGVSIPRNLSLIGLSALLSLGFVGAPTGKKVKAMLWDPNYVWLVDLDARVRTGGIWRMPSQRFREWEVTDGELDWWTPNLAAGKNVDAEEQTIEGVWRGTLTDRELMVALENVKRCRETLEKRAQKGDVFEATGFIIIRNAVSKVVNHVRRTFEAGTLPDDGEALTEEIDSAIEEFGIDRSLDDLVDDDEDPTNDVAGLDAELADRVLDRDDAGDIEPLDLEDPTDG